MMELREVLALLGYVQRIAVALEEIAAKLPAAGSLEFETPQGELGMTVAEVPSELMALSAAFADFREKYKVVYGEYPAQGSL